MSRVKHRSCYTTSNGEIASGRGNDIYFHGLNAKLGEIIDPVCANGGDFNKKHKKEEQKMFKVKQGKKRAQSRLAALTAAVLFGVMLSGCGNAGGQSSQPAATDKTEPATQAGATEAMTETEPEAATAKTETGPDASVAETEPAAETESAANAQSGQETKAGDATQAGAKAGDGQDQLTLEYNSGGDTPTITTVVFNLNDGTVEVSALASSMYEVTYTSTYSVADNKLAIDTATDLTATDTSGVAKVIGLPETMPGNAVHTVSDNGDGAMLIIQFGDPDKLDEAALLGEIEVTADMLAQLDAAAGK